MTVTIADISPIGLCIATQELFDAKRFQANFCDYLLLRVRDKSVEDFVWPMKRSMGSEEGSRKYLDGHKAVIISNIDKILSLASSRYSSLNIKSMEKIRKDASDLIKEVMAAENFNQISALDSDFKTKVTLPVYEMFMEYMKRRGQ